ncbi:MAG TPA: STAS domain-containing protein [Xanthomonadales bacterium]|nr:STAS domain-containing protein [Xanthomonadales bacterium]
MSTAAAIHSNTDGTAALSGELVFSTVRALAAQGEALLAAEKPVNRLDLQAVSRVDSSGLALLLEWQSRTKANGANLLISNAPDDLARLARLCEAEDLLNLNHFESTNTNS